MRFQVLGPLKVDIDGKDVPVAGARTRALLATLLLNAGATVSTRELIASLWGVDAPPSALSSLRNLVGRLRETLGDSGARRLRTVGSGYAIEADRDELDLLEFAELCAKGRAAHERGQWPTCAETLRSALGLWTGEPFDGITGSVQIVDACHRLEEQRLQALRWRIDAELELGRHEDAIAELRSLTGLYPLDEHFHAQLMTALCRAGRQADALTVYRDVRKLISDELGVEPGHALRRLHQRILTADPALAPTGAGNPPRRGRDTEHAQPRQLPAAVGHFVGREAELKALRETAERGGAVVISAISGTAGVGKTALAVRFAHEVAHRFPDGQLYANLRGFDPSCAPSDPLVVARGFLEALGITPAGIPSDPDAVLALYRSKLANTRTLILLDNARDTNQVRPLMPGAAGCLVLVTSRNMLTGLVALDGATPLTLDLFTAQEAGELLTRRLGAERTGGEPDAAAHLARLCARLPLALNIAAARAAAYPGASLRSVADQLGDTQRRLDALSAEEGAADVRAVFSWSYQTLDGSAALLFRLLGLHPGPDISAAAAASLSGLAPDEARSALNALVRAHLIAEPIPSHYALHDLLRAYAVELASGHATEEQRHQAKRRMFDHYLHSAHRARQALNMGSQMIALEAPCPGTTPEDFADRTQARAWFRTEHSVLIAICGLAAEGGFDAHAWQLAWAVASYLDGAGYWTEIETTSRSALVAAERADDPVGVAHAHRNLGYVRVRRTDYPGALAHFGKALALFDRLGERGFQASVLEVIAWTMRYQNRATEALAHDEQALEIHEAIGQAGTHPWLPVALGWDHAMLGNHEAALAHSLNGLAISRASGNLYAEAAALHGTGSARFHLGDYATAIADNLEELALRREIGDYYYEAEALQTLGDSYLASGDAAAARSVWEQAVVIYDDLKHSDVAAVHAKLRELDANALADVGGRDSAIDDSASHDNVTASSARD
jgi:DNA-binding SARP family transcriptional activator